MSTHAGDVFKLIGYLQDDLRKTQARLVEIRALLASLNLPTPTSEHVCPKCAVDRRTADQLADHLVNVHGEGLSVPRLHALDVSEIREKAA